MPISLNRLKDIILKEEEYRKEKKSILPSSERGLPSEANLLKAIVRDIDDIILYINIARHKNVPPHIILNNIHENLTNISLLLNKYITVKNI
jgi:hypothetical protein